MSLSSTFTQQAPPLRLDDDGVVRVGGTRVTLDTLVHMFENGAAPEEIAHAYDCLALADVYAAISYYLKNRVEVQQYLSARQVQATQTRQKNTGPDQHGIRERLLLRQKGS
jgi:uncharacterized protein (DUF433 family)